MPPPPRPAPTSRGSPTSPHCADFQALDRGDLPLDLRVAKTIARDWNTHGKGVLVTGTTWCEEIRRVRGLVGGMPLWMLGIGAQGSDVEAVMRAGCTTNGSGLMIASSCDIIYAGDREHLMQAARGGQ